MAILRGEKVLRMYIMYKPGFLNRVGYPLEPFGLFHIIGKLGLKEEKITQVMTGGPDRERVENGLEFRNTFHLHPRFLTDIFVPCGGQPSSININNWTEWIGELGQPRFKVIAEGANLFIMQQAHPRLEEKGVTSIRTLWPTRAG